MDFQSVQAGGRFDADCRSKYSTGWKRMLRLATLEEQGGRSSKNERASHPDLPADAVIAVRLHAIRISGWNSSDRQEACPTNFFGQARSLGRPLE